MLWKKVKSCYKKIGDSLLKIAAGLKLHKFIFLALSQPATFCTTMLLSFLFFFPLEKLGKGLNLQSYNMIKLSLFSFSGKRRKRKERTKGNILGFTLFLTHFEMKSINLYFDNSPIVRSSTIGPGSNTLLFLYLNFILTLTQTNSQRNP